MSQGHSKRPRRYLSIIYANLTDVPAKQGAHNWRDMKNYDYLHLSWVRTLVALSSFTAQQHGGFLTSTITHEIITAFTNKPAWPCVQFLVDPADWLCRSALAFVARPNPLATNKAVTSTLKVCACALDCIKTTLLLNSLQRIAHVHI